jgi:hypothetical protein
MHVSDWFPTMLALAGITYTPDSEHSLDGVNQVDGWLNVRTPRDTLLYNYYTALTDYSFNIWYNGSFAVRDERFKLMHTYDDSLYGAWYNPTDIVDTDEELTEDNRCAQQFLSGDFTVRPSFFSFLSSFPHKSNPCFILPLQHTPKTVLALRPAGGSLRDDESVRQHRRDLHLGQGQVVHAASRLRGSRQDQD